MLLSPLFYRYSCTWELHTYPCSIEVLCVQVALLTGKYSGPMGLAVRVHFVCILQGGSQHCRKKVFKIFRSSSLHHHTKNDWRVKNDHEGKTGGIGNNGGICYLPGSPHPCHPGGGISRGNDHSLRLHRHSNLLGQLFKSSLSQSFSRSSLSQSFPGSYSDPKTVTYHQSYDVVDPLPVL